MRSERASIFGPSVELYFCHDSNNYYTEITKFKVPNIKTLNSFCKRHSLDLYYFKISYSLFTNLLNSIKKHDVIYSNI